MNARFLLVLAFAALLSACAARPSARSTPTPTGHPGITIHAPEEQVRHSLIIQQTGEAGAILVSTSENRLTFVKQVPRPFSEVTDDVKPSGAPYVREIYTLTREARITHVSLTSELVRNYGTASASAQPLDTPAIRQTQQRNLLRLRIIVEKR